MALRSFYSVSRFLFRHFSQRAVSKITFFRFGVLPPRSYRCGEQLNLDDAADSRLQPQPWRSPAAAGWSPARAPRGLISRRGLSSTQLIFLCFHAPLQYLTFGNNSRQKNKTTRPRPPPALRARRAPTARGPGTRRTPCSRSSERDGVSTSGVTAIFMLFDRGTFCVLPLTYSISPEVPGRTFSPNLSKFITSAAATLVLTPFVRKQGVRQPAAEWRLPGALLPPRRGHRWNRNPRPQPLKLSKLVFPIYSS